MNAEQIDVLVVGAGISGISAAWHLKNRCPGRRFAILEAREDLGGTWDLFRYPGMRSDSDMFTLGFSFRPWTGEKSIAGAPEILQYLRDTVREHGLGGSIRFGHRVRRASWSSADALWTVEIERAGSSEPLQMRCNFLFMCSGYYDYAEGYAPEFPGIASFTGRVVHPQRWTEDVEYADKQVVVIGSGATAVTMVPELAKRAAHVTMLQRSPSYMLSRPSVDPVGTWLRRRLPWGVAHGLTRWKNLLLGMYLFRMCRRKPQQMKAWLQAGVRQALGADYDIGTHFNPPYNPWQQRLCLVPDGDLFDAIRSGRASVVTDHIDTFTARGIRLRSGAELAADLVITATGLKLKVLSGMEISVDGAQVDPSQLVVYKGLMYRDLPNFAATVGYTNASWTLKADLVSAYVCRVLNHMQKTGARRCVPRLRDRAMALEPSVDFSSGYFQRAMHLMPKQGAIKPWKLNQNYLADLLALRFAPVENEAIEFAA